jgi:hypothetical protein
VRDIDLAATLAVTCPECTAAPGQPCFNIDVDAGNFCHSARAVWTTS